MQPLGTPFQMVSGVRRRIEEGGRWRQSRKEGSNATLITLAVSICLHKPKQDVWKEVAKIPFGTTVSYGEIAQKIGRPKTSRFETTILFLLLLSLLSC